MPEGLRMLAMTTARHYVALKGANEPLTLASNTLTGLWTFEAIIVGSVTVAFFFWNYLESIYGPS